MFILTHDGRQLLNVNNMDRLLVDVDERNNPCIMACANGGKAITYIIKQYSSFRDANAAMHNIAQQMARNEKVLYAPD